MNKLFVFRPAGYGPYTYSVMADTEEEARSAVKSHCFKNGITDPTEWGGIDEVEDGRPQYSLEVYGLGEVAENENA